jgi:hypothetical protein
MNLPESSEPSAQGQFLVYPTEDGQVKIDVRLQGETAPPKGKKKEGAK